MIGMGSADEEENTASDRLVSVFPIRPHSYDS